MGPVFEETSVKSAAQLRRPRKKPIQKCSLSKKMNLVLLKMPMHVCVTRVYGQMGGVVYPFVVRRRIRQSGDLKRDAGDVIIAAARQ